MVIRSGFNGIIFIAFTASGGDSVISMNSVSISFLGVVTVLRSGKTDSFTLNAFCFSKLWILESNSLESLAFNGPSSELLRAIEASFRATGILD